MEKERVERYHSENPILIDDEPGYKNANVNDIDRLFFKNERLYKHRTFRVNYTTYDVRRAQDVINPNTTHRDIMVLRDDSDDLENQGDSDTFNRFLYARVLGVHHVNVVYMGCGTLDYQPRRLEFLWVRWYQPTSLPSGWDSRRLDCVKFFPMAHEHAFGFLDPADVIRACHILPRMELGKVHQDIGLSVLAKDGDDWQYYYINRFAFQSLL